MSLIVTIQNGVNRGGIGENHLRVSIGKGMVVTPTAIGSTRGEPSDGAFGALDPNAVWSVGLSLYKHVDACADQLRHGLLAGD